MASNFSRLSSRKLTQPGGYISFGTMPPVAHSGEFVTTPVEIPKTIPAAFTNGTKKITEWTLTVEATTWNNNTDSTPYQAVVDSGNYFFVLPSHLAAKINADFDTARQVNQRTPRTGVLC